MSFSRQDNPSTRPYLIRALHEWCCDHGFTPYMSVQVDASVQVPLDYVKNGEIVLNVSVESTSALRLGNDFIEFKARFGGEVREIVVPVDHVTAIYARENGQGMAFPAPAAPALASVSPMEGGASGALDAGDSTPDIPLSLSEPRATLRSVPSEPKVDVSTSSEADDPGPPNAPVKGSTKRPTLKRIK